MRCLSALFFVAASSACGEPLTQQLVRGRIAAVAFSPGPALERVTATGSAGLIARATIDPEGALLLALPPGDRYRITLESGEARAYTLYDGDAAELDVRCAGALHDLGAIHPRVRNCCDELAAQHQTCLVDCTNGGESVAACWLRCREAEERVEACTPRRGTPECNRIEGAIAEHPYAGADACGEDAE